MFRLFGGDVHVFAVCQPSVPVLAATALMEGDGEAVPLSLILAGGPIDTRINPTRVNVLAEKRGIDWFRSNAITNVPWPCAGRGRQVYPGFLQLSGFMTMNLDRHVEAHKDMFLHLVRGDGDSADKHREFYDEYLAVMDLTAEFYLQTVDTVFVRHLMPRGLLTHRGRCGAAHALCSAIPATRKVHFECPRVGHYGIFNGARFRSKIAPRMAKFMRIHDPCVDSALTIAQLEHMARLPPRGGQACDLRELDTLAFSFTTR
jgi:poly(3-hydroxybutyrate) depolymerase